MLTLLDPRVAIAIGVLVACGYWGGRYQQYRADTAVHKAERAQQDRDAAHAQAIAVSDARAEEQRRTHAQQEIASNAQDQLNAARADAVAAADVSRRLRQRVDTLLAERTRSNTAAAPGSTPNTDANALLAELFSRTQERLGTLAQDVDAARAAGLACQASYDALTVQ